MARPRTADLLRAASALLIQTLVKADLILAAITMPIAIALVA